MSGQLKTISVLASEATAVPPKLGFFLSIK